jgi:hypothetical protein
MKKMLFLIYFASVFSKVGAKNVMKVKVALE